MLSSKTCLKISSWWTPSWLRASAAAAYWWWRLEAVADNSLTSGRSRHVCRWPWASLESREAADVTCKTMPAAESCCMVNEQRKDEEENDYKPAIPLRTKAIFHARTHFSLLSFHGIRNLTRWEKYIVHTNLLQPTSRTHLLDIFRG